jgi:hypothetical protein
LKQFPEILAARARKLCSKSRHCSAFLVQSLIMPLAGTHALFSDSFSFGQVGRHAVNLTPSRCSALSR